MIHTTPIRLFVHGSAGRMGSRIVAFAQEDSRFVLAGSCDRADQNIADALPVNSVDVVVDFSTDDGAQHATRLAVKHNAALVVGTTGLSANSLGIIEKSAESIPVIIAPNTSLGVAVLTHLMTEAIRILGDDFDVDMVEAHHAAKRDAPSGTALRLAERFRQSTGREFPRERIHVIRAGDIVGEHSLEFSGPGERIKISHFATNRDLFARGALRAAAWLVNQKPGKYTIEQTLGLK